MQQRRTFLLCAIFIGGTCALSWQIVWQSYAALAIGSSAQATALVLVAFTIGLTSGALLANLFVQKIAKRKTLVAYAVAELGIAVSGLLLHPGMAWLAAVDSDIYRWNKLAASPSQAILVTTLFFLPALAMGLTTPLFGQISKIFALPISLLYGINTLGAAIGVLIVAFLFLPQLGILLSSYLTAALNIAVAVLLLLLYRYSPQASFEPIEAKSRAESPLPLQTYGVVFTTGFVTFLLEVAWFRSLRAAFFSTSQTLALILFVVLLCLGVASLSARSLLSRFGVGVISVVAAILILITTPLVERTDLRFIGFGGSGNDVFTQLIWMIGSIGPAIFVLGAILPYLMDRANNPGQLGKLYALNGLGSAIGSLSAAFIILPTLGFSRTAWLAGVIMLIAGLSWFRLRHWALPTALVATSLAFGIHFESGVGRTRVFGANSYGPHEILEIRETPDSTISAIRLTPYDLSSRVESDTVALFIDGFAAAAQWGEATSYMAWMGHIPMLLHSSPQNALVICFGTGQTVNAVRREGPAAIDVIDLNNAVFQLAHHFTLNEQVLDDPRVTPIVMDGRIWLRRTPKRYDVITLEPLPPNFAGTNALYSREFYQLAQDHLNEDGVIAQWLPAHLVTAAHARAIVSTFLSVFPHAFLWSDSRFGQAVIIGRNSASNQPFPPPQWPGFQRINVNRSLTETQIYSHILLDAIGLDRYSVGGEIITDDNQLLSYNRPLNLRASGTRDAATVLGEFHAAANP